MVSIESYGLFPFSDSYGRLSFNFKFEDFDTYYLYRRNTSTSEKVEFILPKKEISNILIQPSEPFLKDLNSTFLMFKFLEPISLLPETKLSGFVDFPLNLSIFFISTENDYEHIDNFSIAPTKLALYGNPHNGIICRYWETSFKFSKPYEKPFETGVLELTLTNPTSSKVIVSKVVLNFSFIEIFYHNLSCISAASVKILSDKLAETEFNKPYVPAEFQKSIDLIPTKILSSSKFLMEFGL